MRAMLKNRIFEKPKFRIFSSIGSTRSAPARVLDWIAKNELQEGGIRVHSKHMNAYPEVTGYLIPTVLYYGEKELALRLSRWLIAIQQSNGSFTDPDHGKSHVFDTGQVLRGLLAAAVIDPRARIAAKRAADYLCSQMTDEGRSGFGKCYDNSVPESVLLYVLPPLLEAAQIFDRPDYIERIENCLKYYFNHTSFLNESDLTHFLSYELEALIDLGYKDIAIPVLDKIENLQLSNGAVRGVGGKSWVCVPGLAQLAICWYKIGRPRPADLAMTWLEGFQNQSGGWFGSYGAGASYFPKVEISWAAKFYLDAHTLRVLSFIERNLEDFSSKIDLEDGRVQSVARLIKDGDRVIEVGCGKGRFLNQLKAINATVDYSGLDISPAMLKYLPEIVTPIKGAIENIPIADEAFDVSFSVEAVEHSANIEASVREMARITRPGGWISIIDKQRSAWGRMSCPPWERWPSRDQLIDLLRLYCDDVSVEEIGYDGRLPDGLMLHWKGRKRSRMTGHEWNAKLLGPDSRSSILNRIKANKLTDWGQAVINATNYGDEILEIGSGTGEISLTLARAGRKVSILDVSRESLDFTLDCARELDVEISAYQADATMPLPFMDNEFDSVWSSGLLEHFTPAERHRMLTDWSRVSRRQLISLVPNASSVAYRAGKLSQEQAGTWPYGLEVPILSLRQEYESVGLRVTDEFTVAPRQALKFLPPHHPLRKALIQWMDKLSQSELDGCSQGYLLVTIGVK